MPTRITVFSDFICPFCYIGIHNLRRLQPEFELEIQWRGFQIHPEWPAEGVAAEQFYRTMGEERRKSAWRMIESMAAETGLEMRPPAVLANSYPALQAQEFAIEQGKADEFEQRVFRAYFQEQANIGDRGLLLQLADEVGLDAAQLDQALAEERFAMRLKNTALIAHQRGISGVPTFMIGDYPLVGAQSSEVWRQVLQRASELGV
jgi:predicted DsbA family dithiol-disulfide isomerase